MKNRIAGIELAFDDFKQWHPEVADFASLTAPYEIVLNGFKNGGVLTEVMEKIERQQERKSQIQRVTQLANTTLSILNAISETASALIQNNESLVNATIAQTIRTVVFGCLVFVATLLVCWFLFKRWVENGLHSNLSRLNALTEHDFRHQVESVGPREMREIADNLNLERSARQSHP